MKKLVILILGVLFLIPLSVKADVGPPEIKSYKATPISKDGATIYDKIYGDIETKGKLKYGDEVEITMEVIEKGKTYGYFYNYEDGEDGYVLLSEMKYVRNVDELDEDEPNYAARVFAKDGVDMYEGPSFIYKKIGKISYGEEIKSTDYDNDIGEWLYIEYNGKKGYVNGSNTSVGILYNGATADRDNTEVIETFYIFNYWDGKIAYKTNDGYKIVESVSKSNGRLIKLDQEVTVTKELDVYDRINNVLDSNAKKIGTLQKGDKIEILLDASDYGDRDLIVKSGDLQGWIHFEYQDNHLNIDFEDLTDENYIHSKPVLYDEKGDEPIVDPNEKPKNNTKKGFFEGWTKREIILVSIMGGIVVVLVAVVTLVLVNKKKNKGVQA